MDNYKRRRISIVIGLVAAAVIMVGAIIWVIVTSQSRTPDGDEAPDIQVTIDPDTGDEIINVPGKDPEPNPLGTMTVLGGSQLLDKTTLTYLQYDLTVAIIGEYAAAHVGDINTIKFLPETIALRASAPNGTPTEYAVQVKTVDPEVTINVSIHLVGLDKIRLAVTNPARPELGTFDSGIRPRTDDPGFDEGQ